MVTESAVINPKIVNETRFQFYRNHTASPGNLVPQINVAGSFITGGNGIGDTHDESRHFELQNNTSISHGTHTIRFGVRVRRDGDQSNQPSGFNGTFTFLGGVEPMLNPANQSVTDSNGNPVTAVLTSLAAVRAQRGAAAGGFTEAQIQQLGGGPSRFTIQAGQSYISADALRCRAVHPGRLAGAPQSYDQPGLRYEVQNLIGDHRDIAPRLGFAWAPGKAMNGRQKTVIRGGFGIFYDRIGTRSVRERGAEQRLQPVAVHGVQPDFLPQSFRPLSTLNPGQNTIYLVDPKLRADYSMQGAIGVERQLPRNTTLAVTYTYNRTVHLTQTVPINTPLPGTFNPLCR